jgi:ClpP class serine protease
VAHIPIVGRLTNNVTPSAAFNGKSITTYNYITQATISADANQAVKKIRYHVATGGGDADGVEQTSNAIFFTKKPTEAVVNQAAESGGLWLVSQTDKIISAGKLETFGSLGVAAEFKDRTEAEEKEGTKSVILTSTDAPEKRFDIKTDKGQQIVIKRLDEIHEVFVEHVLRGRQKVNPSITADYIKKNFGRGGSLKAEDALAVGMIDEIQGMTTKTTTNSGAAMVASADQTGLSGNSNQKGKMDEKQFLAFLETNPEAKAYFSEVVASHETKITTMETEHAQAIETAKADASTAIEGNKLSKTDADFIGKILSSAEYGQSVKNCGMEVFTGENDMKMFKMVVANADEQNEKFKLLQIQKDQHNDLQGQDHADLESATSLDSPAISADIKELQAKMGVA